MFIRDSWGLARTSFIGPRISISNEVITNLNAPIFNDGFQSRKWSTIIIHIAGDVIYSTPYDKFEADTLDVFSANTDEIFCVDWGRTKTYERFAIYFDNDLFKDIFPNEEDYKAVLAILDHLKYPNLLRLPDTYKDELTVILNKIDPLLGNNNSNANIEIFTLLMNIFNLLQKSLFSISKKSEIYSHNSLVAKTIQYIENHYKELESAMEIAKEMHVTPEHLSKKFKETTGLSLKSYLQDKKLQYSNHLLSLGYNVTEAANAAGFASYSYFIQLYKSKYGVTPGKKNKNNK